MPELLADDGIPAVAILIIVDVETLLSRGTLSSERSRPSRLDDAQIYILSAQHDYPLGSNDGRLALRVPSQQPLHLRATALALRGEHLIVLEAITHQDAKVLSPFTLGLHKNRSIATLNFNNPFVADSQIVDDYFWQCRAVATGLARCELYFTIVDKAGTVRGYCQSHLLIDLSVPP